MKKIAVKETYKQAYELLKENLPFVILVVIINALVSIIPNNITDQLKTEFPIIAATLAIIFWVASMIVSLGTTKIFLAIVDKKKTSLHDIYNTHPLLLKFFIASLIYGILVGIGLVLFIVPGIILGIKYSFFSYIILDKKVGPLEALKRSGDITKGYKWQLFIFALAAIGLNILGFIAFIVGLLITLPITMIAHALVYRKLSAPSK